MWPLPRSPRGVVSVLWWCLLRESWPSRPTVSLSASVQGQGSKFTSSQKPRQMLTRSDCSLHSALVSAILSRAQTMCNLFATVVSVSQISWWPPPIVSYTCCPNSLLLYSYTSEFFISVSFQSFQSWSSYPGRWPRDTRM